MGRELMRKELAKWLGVVLAEGLVATFIGGWSAAAVALWLLLYGFSDDICERYTWCKPKAMALVVSGACILAVLTISFQVWRRYGPDVSSVPIQSAVPVPSAPTPQASPSPRALPEIYLTVKPKELIGFYKDNTSAQADRLMQAYVGKWMRLSLTVREIIHRPATPAGTEEYVHLMAVPTESSKAQVIFGETVSCTFRGPQIDTVIHMRRGEVAKIVGQLESASIGSITLKNCRVEP